MNCTKCEPSYVPSKNVCKPVSDFNKDCLDGIMYMMGRYERFACMSCKDGFVKDKQGNCNSVGPNPSP